MSELATEQTATADSDNPQAAEITSDVIDTSDADEQTQDTPAPVESDDEEVDYDGEKYKVPKKLKDAFLRQSDYTVKTQNLARERGDFESAQQQFAQRQQLHEQHIEKIAEIKAIDRQLEQFGKLDWNALTDADPVQSMKLERQMRNLQGQRGQHLAEINQAQTKATFESQQATARTLQEARATLAREIPNYGTPELQKAMTETGKAFGYKAEELANVNDPRAVKLLHKAYLYDKLIAKQKASETKANVIPITRVAGSAATVQRSIGDAALSDAEYNRIRREYISKHR